MKKTFWIFLIFSAVLVLGSCTKTDDSTGDLYVPTDSDVTSNATLTELQQGRELYINNCNACHKLYSPDDYSASQWQNIIPDMSPNTSLSSSEVALVTKYLTRGK